MENFQTLSGTVSIPLWIPVAALAVAVVLLWFVRRHYRAKQIQQISKMTREFRQQQGYWDDQRKALEEDAELARSDFKIASSKLDELRREHNRQSAEWQENQHQLSQRTKQLYQLAKKREQEKNQLDKQTSLAAADWKRDKEQLERTNLRLRRELETRSKDVAAPLAEQEKQQRELRGKLAESQADVLALQRQNADQKRWSEQVQQTLEEELARVTKELEQLRGEKVAG